MGANESSAEFSTTDINGFRFQTSSEGPPQGEVVLFLHGFPEFADAWLAPIGSGQILDPRGLLLELL
jgi:pimeloyl-ACP methyl ester carboxylesterase